MRKALDEAGYDDALGNGLYAIGGLARFSQRPFDRANR
jgi:hypothetical protein